MNSPNGVMCLQEMVGSGFPLAVQMNDTLLPSFTVMSDEMSYIFGGTGREKSAESTRLLFEFCNLWTCGRPIYKYQRCNIKRWSERKPGRHLKDLFQPLIKPLEINYCLDTGAI